MSQSGKRRGASRREFLGGVGLAVAGLAVLPRRVLGGEGNEAPSNTLRVAKVGCGGMGGADLGEVAKCGGDFVALCDIDENSLNGAARQFPKAKHYFDFRKMLDEVEKDIDAVVVSTADVCHAVASMASMKRGKAVYCQKPLTRTVMEARLITEAARKYKVPTQMGNQGHGGGGLQATREYLDAGAIGTVKEVHCWSDRPHGWWPQDFAPPTYTDPVPKFLHWDLWIGPSVERPFVDTWREGPFKGKHVFHHANWRGWWDYGAGAIGDMACHNMDPAFWCLDLDAPTWVKATCPTFHKCSFPDRSTIEWEFPAKGDRPSVHVFWHDGGEMPQRPEELEKGLQMGSNGCMFVGDKGKMIGGGWAGFCRIIPEAKRKEFKAPERTLPRSIGHYKEWVEAAKGAKIVPGSNFGYSGPMTEAILLGNVAVHFPGRELRWDAEKLAFTNCPEANALLRFELRKGWEL